MPDLEVSEVELKGTKFRVERWRWVGDKVPHIVRGLIVADQSYCYIRLANGKIARLMDSPWQTHYNGRWREFKPWLYKELQRTGMYWPDAFARLSVHI